MSHPTPETLSAETVTLYWRGEMMGNVLKVEARRADICVRSWAQYSRAIEFRYVPKGRRKERGSVQAYRPSLLVLDGHGHPDPAGLFDGGETGTTENGVTFHTAKYTGCSDGYENDFAAMIEAYIAESGATVLADYRGFETA